MFEADATPERAIHVVAAALIDADRVLLAQRPGGKDLAGLWEFPGGKVEPGETALAALQRELREEIDVRIDVAATRPLIRIPWRYPGKTIALDVYRCERFAGTPRSLEGQALRWVPIADLAREEMPRADHPAITALRLPSTYLITPEPSDDHDDFLRRLRSALDRGCELVQLRAKSVPRESLVRLAQRALAMTQAAGARLLINGDVEMARALALDGVHLTSAQLRSLSQRPLPRGQWVAASCHDARELAHAQRCDVDFVVLGPVLPTASHPGAAAIGWNGFAALASASALPVYALGGLGADDIPLAVERGAQGIAAIGALWPWS